MTRDRKIALVTGAGSGIGRASSIALSEAGFTLVLTGRREDALRQVEAEIVAGGRMAMAVAADISRREQVDRLFKAVSDRFGRLDLLFNNAGTSTGGTPLEDITFDQWQEVVGVNLTGAFLCTQAAFRLMKAQVPQGGRIINNGSVSAQTPRVHSVPYTATKHAITGLTKAVALDGRPYDIVCGQIDIGNAATSRTERMAKGILQPGGAIATEARIDVDIVARTVVHMASLPLEANVLQTTVMASKMPFLGRG